MHTDEVAALTLKLMFAAAILTAGACAGYNLPFLLVPVGIGWVVWSSWELAWNDGAPGFIRDLLGLLCVATVCSAAYGLAMGRDQIAYYGLAGVLGGVLLIIIRGWIARWLTSRRELRVQSALPDI
jgi:hypothetical protein